MIGVQAAELLVGEAVVLLGMDQHFLDLAVGIAAVVVAVGKREAAEAGPGGQ